MLGRFGVAPLKIYGAPVALFCVFVSLFHARCPSLSTRSFRATAQRRDVRYSTTLCGILLCLAGSCERQTRCVLSFSSACLRTSTFMSRLVRRLTLTLTCPHSTKNDSAADETSRKVTVSPQQSTSPLLRRVRTISHRRRARRQPKRWWNFLGEFLGCRREPRGTREEVPSAHV